MEALPPVKGAVPHSVRIALDHLMPEFGLPYRLKRRVSGLGSLGCPRFIALADWQGGQIAREAKALGLSACVWAGAHDGPDTIFYQSILDQAVRGQDHFVRVQGGWLIRRLSSYCSRIELATLPKNEMRPLSCTRWVGRRRMCIWGLTRRSERSSETSPHESPNGCIGLRNR